MPSLSLASYDALHNRIALCALQPLARSCGFLRRCSGKITPSGFLLASCLFALQATPSLSCFAQLWAVLHGQSLSKQAVHKRFTLQAVGFLQAVLQAVLASSVVRSSLCPGLKAGFNRILVQDSTTLALPSQLADLFPGAANGRSEKKAALKIQATLDVLQNRWLHFSLSPFTCNDQGASAQILETLQPRDLIVRDLGYLVVSVFERIQQQGAYFLSRWRNDLKALDARSGAVLKLPKLFGSAQLWDGEVILATRNFPVRVIARRLPADAAARRRRIAKANRDRRLNHSSEYYELMGWNIFLTNVPANVLKAESLIEIYSWRWRIETIFKAWKSHFRIAHFGAPSVEQILVVVLGKLIWICWFSAHWTDLVAEGHSVSVLKLAQWWSKFAPLPWLSSPPQRRNLSDLLRYYCRYERRHDRLNFLERCAALG
jgi:hypothetical protein